MSGFDSDSNTRSRVERNINSNVSGILSTKPTAKYSSGARTVLKINDKIVGFAFNISWRISTSFIEIATIDDYNPHELSPQRITVDGSISALHIPGTVSYTHLTLPTKA